jgi:hypothetical protein
MKIEIVKSSWNNLQRLQSHIQHGMRSPAVKDIEKWLMKGLADAIPGEHRRSEVIDGDLSDYGLIATVELKIRLGRKSTAVDPSMRRSLSSLITELDDAAASKAGTDITE